MTTFQVQILQDSRNRRTGKGKLEFVPVEVSSQGEGFRPLNFETVEDAAAEVLRRRKVTGRVYRVVSLDGCYNSRPHEPGPHLSAREMHRRWIADGRPE